jgi:hypothetical protein
MSLIRNADRKSKNVRVPRFPWIARVRTEEFYLYRNVHEQSEAVLFFMELVRTALAIATLTLDSQPRSPPSPGLPFGASASVGAPIVVHSHLWQLVFGEIKTAAREVNELYCRIAGRQSMRASQIAIACDRCPPRRNFSTEKTKEKHY